MIHEHHHEPPHSSSFTSLSPHRHDHHPHHPEDCQINKLSFPAWIWHQKFPLAAAAPHTMYCPQTFVIFHHRHHHGHYHRHTLPPRHPHDHSCSIVYRAAAHFFVIFNPWFIVVLCLLIKLYHVCL